MIMTMDVAQLGFWNYNMEVTDSFFEFRHQFLSTLSNLLPTKAALRTPGTLLVM